ncbi:MAG: TIGR01212 family radical SAM protein [Paramuribaculum sp.]|nr:TIGR01212 family radical SAM protein [Paramuribaculum sp.]
MNKALGSKPYRDFADFISGFFKGKIQKISVNAALGCPNRDGTIGTGGCTYCNNAAFSPAYTQSLRPIATQLEEGKSFFRRKYPVMKFLCYSQSYTGTHGTIEKLIPLYKQALSVKDVEGLIIATRPDCVPDQLMDELKKLSMHKFIMFEFGAESSHDSTLLRINRCHTWQDTCDAVLRVKNEGFPVGLHLINGLPGEDESMILETVRKVNTLPIDIVKFHQLQVIRNTRLHQDLLKGLYTVPIWNVNEYIALCCKIIRLLRKDIAIERFVSQSPDELLVSPRWGLKNYEFTHLLHKSLSESIL